MVQNPDSGRVTCVRLFWCNRASSNPDRLAISATTKRNFIEDPGLHRTLIGDGLATSLAALFGAPANTTYGENTGVLALTGVYDPFIIRLSAVVAILLGFIPKVSAIGVRNMCENNVLLSKSRNLIIVSVILVCGLGLSSNGLAIAAVVGIILNAILPGKDYEFGNTAKGSSEGTFAVKANSSK